MVSQLFQHGGDWSCHRRFGTQLLCMHSDGGAEKLKMPRRLKMPQKKKAFGSSNDLARRWFLLRCGSVAGDRPLLSTVTLVLLAGTG